MTDKITEEKILQEILAANKEERTAIINVDSRAIAEEVFDTVSNMSYFIDRADTRGALEVWGTLYDDTEWVMDIVYGQRE